MNNLYLLSDYNLTTFPALFMGLAGVYMWTNITNGKRYVGSSVNLGRRIAEYLNPIRLIAELARGESIIYKAMIKYGYTSFSLTLLEIVSLPEDATSEEKADILEETEQKYLDQLNPEYNILKKAGSNLGAKMSEETRQRMSVAKKGKASHRKGKTMSDEARENMSANSVMSKVVYMLDQNMTLVNTYSSITECSLATDISRFRIGRSLDTMKLVDGYYFTTTLLPLH